MIHLEQNTVPFARVPNKVIHNNRKVILHEKIKNEAARQFRFIYDTPARFNLSTTQDGLDAVLWAEIAHSSSLYIGQQAEQKGLRLAVAIVHSNSRRQKTAIYGGLNTPDGSLVFERIIFKPREDKLEERMDKAVARLGLFVDQYFKKYRELDNFRLNPAEYNRLLVECARGKYLSWSRMTRFDHERDDNETALNFLLRFSRHVGRQPIISYEPARSQPLSQYGAYRLTQSLRV